MAILINSADPKNSPLDAHKFSEFIPRNSPAVSYLVSPGHASLRTNHELLVATTRLAFRFQTLEIDSNKEVAFENGDIHGERKYINFEVYTELEFPDRLESRKHSRSSLEGYP